MTSLLKALQVVGRALRSSKAIKKDHDESNSISVLCSIAEVLFKVGSSRPHSRVVSWIMNAKEVWIDTQSSLNTKWPLAVQNLQNQARITTSKSTT